MFIELEKQVQNVIAALDDNGTEIGYKDIIAFSELWTRYIDHRCLCFVLSNNSVGTLLGYMACMINKIVPLVVGADTKKDALNHLLTTYQPAYIWAPKEFESDFSCVYEAYDYKLLKTGLKEYELYSELSLLLTTSGSTGSPKLVRHSYENLEAQARNVSKFFEITNQDRAVVSLPMQYTMGLSIIISHLYKGATVLLTNKSVLSGEYWKYIREQKATSITGVPYNFEMMYRLRIYEKDFPSLKLLTQGGGKLSRDIQIKFAEYMQKQKGRYIATYGQTEGSARMAYLPAEYAISKCGSIGKAIPNGKIYIVDETGNEINQSYTEGEMVYEGPNVTMGYALCGADLSKGDENRGKLFTGDIVYRDEDGFIYIVGRKKRFLKLFGHRVGLDECEQIIKAKYAIECACVGNDKKLYIYLTEEDYKEKVKDHILEQTGLYASVIEVCIIQEIPKNKSGKIMYNSLEKQEV